MSETVKVTAVEYRRPFGRREEVTIEIPKELEPKYQDLRDAGCNLAGEALRTGHVSLTIEHTEGDFACEVVPNGPEVNDAVKALLQRWDRDKFNRWLEATKAVGI